MHTPHPPQSSMRPSTAAPGRRNLTLTAVTAPVTAAPQVTAAATRPVTVRVKKSDLRPLEPPNIIGSKALRKIANRRKIQWLSDQPIKPLSPINDGDITPPPRILEMQKAARLREAEVRARMAENRATRDYDRGNYSMILNKQPQLIPVPPSDRPPNSRSNRHGLRVPTINSGSLDLPHPPPNGGRTRARKMGRKGRKGTNKRRRYIVAKTRRQRRGNN